MSKQIETRTLATRLEIRGTNDKPQLVGRAAAYNVLSQDLGGFRERLMPGAFSRALREKHDVRALFNHDPNVVLGRTKNGTLRLAESVGGLDFVVDLPDTQAGRDVREMVRRGDVDQCSFSFLCREDAWTEENVEEDGERSAVRVRNVRDLTLFDVSSVTYPAYTECTVVAARSRSNYNEAPSTRRVELYSPEEARALAENRQREAAAKQYSDKVESWRTAPMGNDAGIQEFIRKEKERGR